MADDTDTCDLSPPLLDADEPPPVMELNRGGRSDYLITVDHASHAIPRRLRNLGLAASELTRHIGWGIGALAVARRVSSALDAPLIAQNYSRLVIDCNRNPNASTSIASVSEYTPIPGNDNLSPQDAQQRCREIFLPYHRRIEQVLDERRVAGRPTMLVAQHSMTDCFMQSRREMHAAVLYNRDPRLARAVLTALRREPLLLIAENEPYCLSDETDYSIPRHGEARGLPHVEIEIRQDLIAHEHGQAEWGERIARALLEALSMPGTVTPMRGAT